MTDHKIGTREEWLAARLELLEAEKELTRHSELGPAAAGAALGSNRQFETDGRRYSVPCRSSQARHWRQQVINSRTGDDRRVP
jgi:hypothetical protein